MNFLTIGLSIWVIGVVIWVLLELRKAPIQCDECKRLFKNKRGLAIHKGKIHN